jgi:TetR/AcrR family transcriptional regulator, lmrAB and yxaGH operons repressor
MTASTPGTRERMVAAMRQSLQRRGLHAVGLNDILEQADAPKGSLYHHFPGGKTALAVAAVEATTAELGQALQTLMQTAPSPAAALQTWIQGALKRLEASGFECGCPLATVALESTADDVALRTALAEAFATMRGQIADALQRAGHAPEAAAALAALIVAAYEGGLLQARVAQSLEPLQLATRSLLTLLAQAKP